MAPKLLSLHFLVTLLTAISLEFAQAGSDTSPSPFSKVKASSGSVLATRAEGGIGTCSPRCKLGPIAIVYLKRIILNSTGDFVQWTDWTSGDGTQDSKDADGILYIRAMISAYIAKYPDPNDRIGIFWTGGHVTEDDFYNIDEFLEMYTANRGKRLTDIYDYDFFQKMGLDGSNKNNLWWRASNRASKALSAVAYGGTAYVYSKPNNCRNLFSPPSQKPQDSDPDHGGQATNGEIWYYAEFPTLMRNLNVNKIVTFYKTEREPGKPPKFVQTTQWDVAVVSSL